MTYDTKYDAMPLRGKVSVAALKYRHDPWLEENRRYWRKFHRHYDPHKDWWTDDTIGVSFRHLKWCIAPSKGHKRKTWRDYN